MNDVVALLATVCTVAGLMVKPVPVVGVTVNCVEDAGGEVVLVAEQLAVVPLFLPEHTQLQGPEPVTVVSVPAEQRFVIGADASVCPLLLPQAPLIGTEDGSTISTESLAEEEIFPAASLANAYSIFDPAVPKL